MVDHGSVLSHELCSLYRCIDFHTRNRLYFILIRRIDCCCDFRSEFVGIF